MKEVTIEVLKEAAERLMFEMDESQYQALLEEFKILQKQMDTISKVEGLDEYEPMTFPFPCSVSFLREDIPDALLTQKEALANARSTENGQIKIPKVVGK